MKNLIALLLLALSGAAFAAGAGIHMDPWPDAKAKDTAALQNGAKLFANYCLNCHSANLMRWNRLADIGLDDKVVKSQLIFGNQKVGDLMTISAQPKDQKAWFGKVPPDLSVIVRARTTFDYRGADYLYTLFRSYYRDASTPTGWNNAAYPNIAMPHIFWERQGPREATLTRVVQEGEGAVKVVSVYDADGYATVTRTPVAGGHAGGEGMEVSFKALDGKAAAAYDSDVADLVAYLNFMTDPSAAKRSQYGVWVMLFLLVFAASAWYLSKQYWKNVK